MKCCYKNILETSTVTVSLGTADASYPVYRLWDRDISDMFKITAAETMEIKIDQGVAPLPIDRLLIPSGHNFAGMTIDLLASDTDSGYAAALTQWTGAAGLINKPLAAPITKRWLKYKITSPGVIPYFAELFLGSTYTWEKAPSRPTGPLEPITNVETRLMADGKPMFCVHGSPRRQRVYPMTRPSEAQKDNILALNDAWAGSKPFWLEDHLGAWIYGYLRKPIELKEIAYQRYVFVFDFEEILP